MTLEHSQRGHGQGQLAALPDIAAAVAASSGQRHQRTAGWARPAEGNCGGFGLFGPSLGDTRFDAARRATLTFYLIFRLAAFLHDSKRKRRRMRRSTWWLPAGLSSHSICMASILKCPESTLDIMLHIIYNHMTPAGRRRTMGRINGCAVR